MYPAQYAAPGTFDYTTISKGQFPLLPVDFLQNFVGYLLATFVNSNVPNVGGAIAVYYVVVGAALDGALD